MKSITLAAGLLTVAYAHYAVAECTAHATAGPFKASCEEGAPQLHKAAEGAFRKDPKLQAEEKPFRRHHPDESQRAKGARRGEKAGEGEFRAAR